LYEFQIDRLAEVWDFRPFCLEEFQAPTGINYEIHFARSIPPEKLSLFRDRSCYAPGEGISARQTRTDRAMQQLAQYSLPARILCQLPTGKALFRFVESITFSYSSRL
jgi:hypothetical protein